MVAPSEATATSAASDRRRTRRIPGRSGRDGVPVVPPPTSNAAQMVAAGSCLIEALRLHRTTRLWSDFVVCYRPDTGVSTLCTGFCLFFVAPTESKLRFGDASSNSLSSSKSVSMISVAAETGRVVDRSKNESTCFLEYTSVRARVELAILETLSMSTVVSKITVVYD